MCFVTFVPSWLHWVCWRSTAACFQSTPLWRREDVMLSVILEDNSLSGPLRTTVWYWCGVSYPEWGRTSPGLPSPPSWCSPSCRMDCSSYTCHTLTAQNTHQETTCQSYRAEFGILYLQRKGVENINIKHMKQHWHLIILIWYNIKNLWM